MLISSSKVRIVAMVSGIAMAAPATGLAQDAAPARPALLTDLLACRQITASEARLACFDAAAGAFETAQQQGEVTVIDTQAARETRARLFGLNLGTANLFAGLRQDNPISAIETELTSARQDGRGQWTFNLADGSTWRQIDRETITVRMTPGAPVRIRQAAMGSYLLSVGGARSVRARREN